MSSDAPDHIVRRMIYVLSFMLIFAAVVVPRAAHACGPDSDCRIGERIYRIEMPEKSDGKPVGAVIFNHGYRGAADRVMRNRSLVASVTRLGLAFVATKSKGPDWDLANSPKNAGNGVTGESEFRYFDRLKADLVKRHNVDPDRIMITGFSAGGMMTWELACNRGDAFAAFAPIAGTFWSPVPKSCPTLPAPIIHMHGSADRTVPFKGRRIGETKQGNIYNALKLAAPKRTFGDWQSMGEFNGLTCQEKIKNETTFLQFCIHPGGHSLRSEWIGRAWREFERRGVLGS